jgi:hypothetical protein
MKRIESQRVMIKRHLLEGYHISPLKALKKYGCFRLSAVVHKLRKEGIKIKTTIADGDAPFAIYTLEEKK